MITVSLGSQFGNTQDWAKLDSIRLRNTPGPSSVKVIKARLRFKLGLGLGPRIC